MDIGKTTPLSPSMGGCRVKVRDSVMDQSGGLSVCVWGSMNGCVDLASEWGEGFLWLRSRGE